MEGSSNLALDCLQPELLEKDVIINILQERELRIENIQDLPKKELVQIYKSYILPLPQRQRLQAHCNKNSLKNKSDANEISNSTKKLKLANNTHTNNTESRKRINCDNIECEKEASGIKRKKQMISWP